MEFFRLFSYLKKNLTQRFIFRPGPEIQLANFSPFLRMQDLARALHLTLKCVFVYLILKFKEKLTENEKQEPPQLSTTNNLKRESLSRTLSF